MKKRRWLGNIAVTAVTVIVCLAAFEFYLSLDNARPETEIHKVELNGNAYGLLEGDAAFDATEEAVAFIGDSFTMGYACGEEGNFPRAFEAVAQEGGLAIRAINMGVPGADVYDYLDITKDFLVSQDAPKAAVVTLYSNDMDYGYTCAVCRYLEEISNNKVLSADELNELKAFCKQCSAKGNDYTAGWSFTRRAHTWLHDHSYTYGLFREGFAKASLSLGLNVGWGRTAFPAYWQEHDQKPFKLLLYALARIHAELKAVGTPMVVVIYPDVSQISNDNAYVEIYDDAAKYISERLGVPVYSGYEAFLSRTDVDSDMTFSLTDSHPNCKAHQVFGTWVFDKLVETLDDSLGGRVVRRESAPVREHTGFATRGG